MKSVRRGQIGERFVHVALAGLKGRGGRRGDSRILRSEKLGVRSHSIPSLPPVVDASPLQPSCTLPAFFSLALVKQKTVARVRTSRPESADPAPAHPLLVCSPFTRFLRPTHAWRPGPRLCAGDPFVLQFCPWQLWKCSGIHKSQLQCPQTA